MTSARMMREAGHPGLMLWGHMEGWGEEGRGKGASVSEGTCVYLWPANSCGCTMKAFKVL